MKEKTNALGKVILVIIRYKYLVVICFFAIWITFLDSYNLIDRFKNMQKLNALNKEVEFFKHEIKVYNTQYKELFSDKNDLEKFAREQYLMKEENEDIFIIISD